MMVSLIEDGNTDNRLTENGNNMKRIFCIALLSLFTLMIYAQKFEVISEFKFNNKISYYEDWIDDDGHHAPGISELFVIDKTIYAYNYSQSEWFSCYKNNYKKMTIQNCGYNYLNIHQYLYFCFS